MNSSLTSAQKAWSLVAVLLLLTNGAGAVYGGTLLILDPSGARMGLPLNLLAHSPFADYLIPGIVLLTFNGVSSVVIAVAAAMRVSWFPLLTILQGVVLNGWLMVQINMIQYVYFLHYVMGTVAVALIAVGWMCRKGVDRK